MVRKAKALVALMLVLSALAISAGPNGGQIIPELTFTRLTDQAVDTNDNTLYDSLIVQVNLEVTQGGTYTFVCDLSVEVSGTSQDIHSIFANEILEEGGNTVDLVFPSEPIFRKGVSGVLRADIEVQKTDYIHPWNTVYLTRFYDHERFEAPENPPPVPPDAPKVELDLNFVNVSTETFRVFVNRTSPQIVFRYLDPPEWMPDFVVVYSRLLLYNDDGNGHYNGEDLAAGIVLTNYQWALSDFDVSGPRVSFDLRTRVPIPVSDGFVSADLSLEFTVTNGTTSVPDMTFIRGDASEIKVDFSFEPDGAISDADRVALESTTWDTRGTHDFLVEEPVGFKLYPHTVETPYQPVPRVPVQLFSQVGLVDENQVWHAFVGWMNMAEETWTGSDEPTKVEVGGSFRVKGGRMELVTSYPLSEELVLLMHDPSAGVVAENVPPEPPVRPPEPEPTPNFYLFLFALIVGAVILILTVYARAKGY